MWKGVDVKSRRRVVRVSHFAHGKPSKHENKVSNDQVTTPHYVDVYKKNAILNAFVAKFSLFGAVAVFSETVVGRRTFELVKGNPSLAVEVEVFFVQASRRFDGVALADLGPDSNEVLVGLTFVKELAVLLAATTAGGSVFSHFVLSRQKNKLMQKNNLNNSSHKGV